MTAENLQTGKALVYVHDGHIVMGLKLPAGSGIATYINEAGIRAFRKELDTAIAEAYTASESSTDA